MNTLFEIIYWIRIFLSPSFVALVIIGILTTILGFSYWYLLLLIPSIILGVLLAERARKKYGTTSYVAKTMNTADIEDAWEKEKKK